MTRILYGRPVAEAVFQKILNSCKQHAITPGLAVIQVGDDRASTLYVNRKIQTCDRLGFLSRLIRLPHTISREELKNHVDACNTDPRVHGVLVQLPLPPQFSVREVIQWISPQKDVDGFHPNNVGRLATKLPVLAPPCTPYGVMVLLKAYDISLKGKNVMVLSRSSIVGRPLVQMLVRADATIFWTHRFSVGHERFAPDMDVIISATGIPGIVRRSWVNPKSVVVDVGINTVDKKIVGDVDVPDVDGFVSARSPVPGGVGPLTIAVLMRNVASLALGKSIEIMNSKPIDG